MIALLFVAVILLPAISAFSSSSNCKVVVTGSTGVLGANLLKSYGNSPFELYGSYRCAEKAANLLNFVGKRNNLKLFFMDTAGGSLDNIIPVESLTDSEQVVVFNNAAICDGSSSYDSIMTTNCVFPMLVMNQVLKAARINRRMKHSVINISSGDGELLYFRSDIADKLDSITTLDGLNKFICDFPNDYFQRCDIAHTKTPIYALSKAILNKATRLFHDILTSERLDNMRVVAVCPGNFLSQMTQEDEKDSLLPIEKVVQHIRHVADNFGSYPGGKFYRFGKEITW